MDGQLYLPCPSCGAMNRADLGRLDRGPVCARCKTRLQWARPLEVSGAQFEAAALKSDLPVLVDFWAPWCGPCQSMHPVLEQLAAATAGRALVLKLNTDEHGEVSARYGVRGVPTFILFRRGAEAGRQVGAVPLEALKSMVES